MRITTEQGGLYALGANGLQSTQRIESRLPGFGRCPEAPLDRIEVSEAAALVSRVLDLVEAQRAAEIRALAEADASGRLLVDCAELSRALVDDAVENAKFGELQ